MVTCGQRLLHLWRGRELLGLDEYPQLPALLQRILPAALFLLPGLATCEAERESAATDALLGLREFLHLGGSQAGLALHEAALHETLDRLQAVAPPASPGRSTRCGSSTAQQRGATGRSPATALRHRRRQRRRGALPERAAAGRTGTDPAGG